MLSDAIEEDVVHIQRDSECCDVDDGVEHDILENLAEIVLAEGEDQLVSYRGPVDHVDGTWISWRRCLDGGRTERFRDRSAIRGRGG